MRLFSVMVRQMGSALSRLGVLFVDMVSPGLWEGKAFRVYHEFAANTVIEFVADQDFALDSQSLALLEGEARLEIMTGGTPGGTFTALPTHFNKKLIGVSPATPTFVIGAGGTHTGGTEREVLIVAAATGGNSQLAATASQGKRLLPAGTYYMRIVVTGATRGMWAVEYDVL